MATPDNRLQRTPDYKRAPDRTASFRGRALLLIGLITLLSCQVITPRSAVATETAGQYPTVTMTPEASPTSFLPATFTVEPATSTPVMSIGSEVEDVDNICTYWTFLEGAKDQDGNYISPAWHFVRLNPNEPEPSRQEMISIPKRIPKDVDTLRTRIDLGGAELNLDGFDDAHFFITAPGDVSWYTARFVDEQFNDLFQGHSVDIPLENFEGVNDIEGETLDEGEKIGGTLGIRIHNYMPYDVKIYQALLYNSRDPDCISELGEPEFVIDK